MSNLGDNLSGHLKSFVDRIENLEAQKAEIASDIRDIYKEVKANNLNAAVVRACVRLRAQDPEKRKEFEDELDVYMHALGLA